MTDRPTLEQAITENRRLVTQIERDMRQLRDWLGTNERTVAAMPDSLRGITEDGIIRARADLNQRENDIRLIRDTLAGQERQLALLNEIERKQRDIFNLEREQERIISMLSRYRAELSQFQSTYEAAVRPAITVPPSELVLPSNGRVPLDQGRGEYLIGWSDASSGSRQPDIDLGPLGGGSLGVSRNHAVLRFRNDQWEVEDLGSTNGTFLEDAQIAPRAPTLLLDKTTVRVGSIKLFFRYILQTTRL